MPPLTHLNLGGTPVQDAHDLARLALDVKGVI